MLQRVLTNPEPSAYALAMWILATSVALLVGWMHGEANALGCSPTQLCPTYPCQIPAGTHNLGAECTLDFIDPQTDVLGDVAVPANATLNVPVDTTLEIRARDLELRGVIAAAQSEVAIDLTGEFRMVGGGRINANSTPNSSYGTVCLTASDVWLDGDRVTSDNEGDIDICAGARFGGEICAMGAGSCLGGSALTVSQELSSSNGGIAIAGSSVDVEPSAVITAPASGEFGGSDIEIVSTDGAVSISGAVRAFGSDGAFGGDVTIEAVGGDVSIHGEVRANAGGGGTGGEVSIQSDRDVYVTSEGEVTSIGTANQSSGGEITLISGKEGTVGIAGTLHAFSDGAGVNASDGDVSVGSFTGTPVVPALTGQPCDVVVSGVIDTKGLTDSGGVWIGYGGSLTFDEPSLMSPAIVEAGTFQGGSLHRVYCRAAGTLCASPPVFGTAAIAPPATVIPYAIAPCAACGDGTLGEAEECDDANATEGDGCDTNCTISRCGNGIVGGSEACDDGDAVSGDECDNNCTLPACGNGEVSPLTGEQCDDGNTTSGDGCSAVCKNETVFRVDSSPLGSRAYEPDVGVRLSNGEIFFAWTHNNLCPENGLDQRGIRVRLFSGMAIGVVTPIADGQIACANGAKARPAAGESNYGYPVAYVGANPGTGPGDVGVWLMNWSLTPNEVLIDEGVPAGRPHIARFSSLGSQEADIVAVSFVESWTPNAEVAYGFIDLNPLSFWQFPYLSSLGRFHWTPGPASASEDGHAFNLNAWANGGVWVAKVNPALEFPPVRIDTGGVPTGRVSVAAPMPAADAQGAVVVWKDTRNQQDQIMGRILTWTGFTPAGLTFVSGELVLSQGQGTKYNPVVAVQPNGTFIVAWATTGCGVHGVSHRKFGPTGAPLGGVVNLDQIVPGSRPEVAALPNGEFVMTWERPDGAGGSQIFGAKIGS